MEAFIDLNHGPVVMLASILVILCFHLIFKVGEFVWKILKSKTEITEQSIEHLTEALRNNTIATERLEIRLNEIEKDLAEIPKFKLDLRRLFTAVKKIAGDEWSDIRKVIMDDDLPT